MKSILDFTTRRKRAKAKARIKERATNAIEKSEQGNSISFEEYLDILKLSFDLLDDEDVLDLEIALHDEEEES